MFQAVERIRRWYFEVFWYTHHLFIVFYAMLLAHGTAALLGKLSFSLLFVVVAINFEFFALFVVAITLLFSESAQFWMYFLIPGTAYLIERLKK